MAKKRFANVKSGGLGHKKQRPNKDGFGNRGSEEGNIDNSVMDTVEEENELNEDEIKLEVNNFELENCDNRKQKAQFFSDGLPSREKKRGRIIIRNLSFKTTEEKLLNHFQEFGDISEIKLLKKADGKLVGCGFLQFTKKQNAIRAILKRSGKPFLGRPIICDWALPKDKYLQHVKSETRTDDNIDLKIKEEVCSDDSDDENHMKSEVLQESEEEIKEEVEAEEDDEDEGDSEVDSNEYDSNEEDTKQTSAGNVGDNHSSESLRPKVISNDVSEGCTVFIKNIPFTATNSDLGKCMKQFGPVHYALICFDPVTEHSRGTGFAKFQKKEDAEKCLEAEDLSIREQSVVVMKALSRDDIKSRNEKKNEKNVKDNRHLYLVKEGVILAGSSAAKDVSVSDMEKRLKIEQWKTQILRNLNMFVSNTRLVVHNVPLTWDDNQVRQLFKTHAGPRAVVKEARIMKDLRNVDANGVGASKEFAFVRFTKHEHAIQALRNINNNPDIFSKSKRPIVSFSIENKAIHKIKQKRVQKSRAANAEKLARLSGVNQRPKQKTKCEEQKQNNKRTKEVANEESNTYAGLQGQPGNKKLRTKFNMKTQAAIHGKNVRQSKKKEKLKRKLENHNKKTVEPQPKKKFIVEDDSFGKLVNKYKSKLMSANSVKRWYE